MSVLLVGFWVLMGFGWVWVAIVYYVFTAIVYGLLNSQFWLFANHLVDPRQAKRLFGFIGAGASYMIAGKTLMARAMPGILPRLQHGAYR